MNARARFLMFAAAAVLWVAGQGVAGCATGGDTTDGDDDDGVAGTNAGGSGQGGDAAGGAGGGAGGGGQGPCAMDCSQIQTDQCTVGQCNTESGSCEIVYVADGTECDDGEFCSLDDQCEEGACVGGVQNDCGDVPSACETVVCNEQSQSCSTQALPDGTFCAASDPCIINAQCLNGLCIGSQKDCLFAPVPNECYVSQCNPNSGDCEPEPANDGVSCHDENDKCLINGTCSAGACENTQPMNCAHLTVPQSCQVGSCNSVTGQCEQSQVAENDPCDDLDGCSSGEICQQSVCTGGVVIDSCGDDDGCCPAGCDELSDNDCVLQILLMGESVDPLGWNSFRNALSASGAVWTEWDLDNQPFPSAGMLGLYDTLIWFDESSSSVLDADAQTVANWLQSGGRNLFVAGIDLLNDFGTATGGSGEHNLYSLWGATYVGTSAGTAIVTIDGVVGDPIGWDFAPPNGLELAMNADSSGDYANELSGAASTGMLYGAGGTGSGRAALSHYDAGTYRVVWFGANFHNGLVNPLQRAQLMHNTLTFFSE